MTKKITILFSVFIFSCMFAQAQYYTGVGARVGKFASGLTVKHFFDATNSTAFEIIVADTKAATGGYLLTGMLEKQYPIRSRDLHVPIDLILGVGLHAGYYNSNYFQIKNGERVYYGKSTISSGIDGMIGVEYQIPIAPLTLGVDCNPYLDLYNRGPEFLDFCINIRYVFQ